MADESFTQRIRNTEIGAPQIQVGRPGSDISTAIGNLQASLQSVVNFQDRKAAIENEELLKQVDILIKADELAGIEQDQQAFIARHKDVIGDKNIQAITHGFGRKLDMASGRVQGRRAVRALQTQVNEQKFATPEDFEKEVDRLANEATASHPKDGFTTAGFLEAYIPNVEEFRNTVNTQFSERRMAEGRNAFSALLSEELEILENSKDPAAEQQFRAQFFQLSQDLMDQTPGDEIGREQVIVSTIQGWATEEHNYGRVTKLVNIAIEDGHVTDPDLKKQLLNTAAVARGNEEQLALRDDPEQLRQAKRIADRAVQDIFEHGSIQPRTDAAMRQNRLALNLVNAALADIQGIDRNSLVGGSVPTPQEIQAIDQAMMEGNEEALRSAVSTARSIELAGSPQGQEFLRQRISYLERVSSGDSAKQSRAAGYLQDRLRVLYGDDQLEPIAQGVSEFHVALESLEKKGDPTQDEVYALADTVFTRREKAVRAETEKIAADPNALPQTVAQADAQLAILEPTIEPLRQNVALARQTVIDTQNQRGPAGEDPPRAFVNAAAAQLELQSRALAARERRVKAIHDQRKLLEWRARVTKNMQPDEAINSLVYNGSTELSVTATMDPNR